MVLHGVPALLFVLVQQICGLAVGTSPATTEAGALVGRGVVDGAQVPQADVRFPRRFTRTRRHLSSMSGLSLLVPRSHEPTPPYEPAGSREPATHPIGMGATVHLQGSTTTVPQALITPGQRPRESAHPIYMGAGTTHFHGSTITFPPELISSPSGPRRSPPGFHSLPSTSTMEEAMLGYVPHVNSGSPEHGNSPVHLTHSTHVSPNPEAKNVPIEHTLFHEVAPDPNHHDPEALFAETPSYLRQVSHTTTQEDRAAKMRDFPKWNQHRAGTTSRTRKMDKAEYEAAIRAGHLEAEGESSLFSRFPPK